MFLKRKKMLTAFAECDFEIPSFSRLSETMFDFMPSSIEVIEPNKVSLDITEATDLLNNISGRMHRFDEISKIAGERLRQMNGQLQAMQKALIDRDEKIVELEKGGAHKTVSAKKKSVKKSSKKVKKK